MSVSYNGLWKLLIDKNMKKIDLMERVDISSSTVAKMTKGEAVSLKILEKICDELDYDFGDLISAVVFQDIYKDTKYKYSNRYLFPFNQKMDDRFFRGNQTHDIGVTVITPYGGDYPDSALRMLSAQEHSVIVKLPSNSTFLDEIRESIKIYKYLNKNAVRAGNGIDSIRRAKEDERIEKKDRIRIFIEDALKHAEIYVNGDKAHILAKDPVSRINEALGKLVAMQYNKLIYMETAPELSDIAAVFNGKDGQMSFLGTRDTTPNKLALEEVIQVISLNNARHMKTSLKSLQDKFGAAPYGFDQKDVQWLVAMLFKMGRVSLTYNSQMLSMLSNTKEELVRYLTKRDFVEKLLIDIRERATDGQIRSAKEVLKDYFGYSLSSDDDDTIMRSFKDKAKDKLEVFGDILVEYRINPKLPCKSLMEHAKKSLEDILAIKEPAEFFRTVDKKRDELLDDGDDTAPVFDFFKNDQKKIFERALDQIQMFENSKTYVREQEIIDNVAQMEAIVNDKNPFGQIRRLPDMSMKFIQQYGTLLEKEAEGMRPVVEDDLQKVLNTLEEKKLDSVFRDKFLRAFGELKNKLDQSHEIAAVKNIRLESDTLKLRCLDEITDYEIHHQPAKEPPVVLTPPTEGGKDVTEPPAVAPVKTKVKKRKNVSISNVAGARTYTLETEEDIDKFAEGLKRKLKAQLDKDTIIILS